MVNINLAVRRRVKSAGRRIGRGIGSLKRLKGLVVPTGIALLLIAEGLVISKFVWIALALVPLSIYLLLCWFKVVELRGRIEELKRAQVYLVGLQKELEEIKRKAGIE